MKKKLIISVLAATAVMASPGQVNRTDARGYLTRAELMFLDHNYNGCIDQVSQARRESLSPDGERDAAFFEALASAALGRREAYGLLTDYIAEYQGTPDAVTAQLALAGLYYDHSDYADALKCYRGIPIERIYDDQKPEYFERKGYCLLKLGEYDSALECFDALASLPGHANTARFYQGYVAYAKEDYDKAASLFKRVNTSTAPGNMADFYLSQIYFSNKDYEKALSTSRKLLKNNGGVDRLFTAEAERIAGESLYHLGNDAQAVDYLKRYVNAQPDGLPSAYYILGLSEYRRQDYRAAVEYLSHVTGQENAMGQSAYLLIGQSYLKEGNVDGALLALNRALQRDYDSEVSETAFYNYAVAKTNGGRVPFGSSVAAFEEFLQRYPRSHFAPKVQEYVISGYLTDDNYESALASISRISEPSAATLKAKQQVLYTLGSRDIMAGEIQRGLSRLREAKSMGALNEDTYRECDLWIGDALYREGDYDGAAAAYLDYLGQLPRSAQNRPLGLYNLGYARFGAKKFDDALTDFTGYVNAPGTTAEAMQADARNRMGDCYYYAGEFGKASSQYDTAYQLAPSTGDYALYQKGLMKGLQRDHKGKIVVMRELMERFPSSGLVPSALLEMAEAYGETGDNANAIATYKRLVKDYSPTAQGRQGYLLLAITYMDQGQRDRAIDSYKTVLKNYPTSEEARVAADDLKRIYSDMGRLDEFAAYISSIDGAPRMDAAEVERLTFQSAEKDYINNGSVKRLKSYIERFPSGQEMPTALQYMAEYASGKGDDSSALAYASRIVNDYRDSRSVEGALAIKGDVEYRQGKGEIALATFRELERRSSSATSLNAARLGILKVSRDLGRHNDVIEIADDLLVSTALSDTERDDVTFARGYASMSLGRTDKAVKDWSALAGDPDKLAGAKSAYYLGQLYYDQGNLKKARKTVDALVEANPPHHYWLARGFILLSDIYRKQGNNFEADEYLKTLRDNYPGKEPDIFNMIDSRLNAAK